MSAIVWYSYVRYLQRECLLLYNRRILRYVIESLSLSYLPGVKWWDEQENYAGASSVKSRLVVNATIPWITVFAYRGYVPWKCRMYDSRLYRECRGFGFLRKRAVQIPWFLITLVPRLSWFWVIPVPWCTVSELYAEDRFRPGGLPHEGSNAPPAHVFSTSVRTSTFDFQAYSSITVLWFWFQYNTYDILHITYLGVTDLYHP